MRQQGENKCAAVGRGALEEEEEEEEKLVSHTPQFWTDIVPESPQTGPETSSEG